MTPDGSSAAEERLLEVGRIHKPHGVRGDLLVSLVTDVVERLDAGSVLHLDPGTTTVEVVRSRPHQDRWIVHLVGVDDRDAAEALRGRVLLAPPIDDPDELWVHELIGARVVTADGRDRGRVVAVVDNPAADLLELESGALVPLTFVTGRSDDGRLAVDPPAGLFELYE